MIEESSPRSLDGSSSSFSSSEVSSTAADTSSDLSYHPREEGDDGFADRMDAEEDGVYFVPDVG